MNNNTQEPDMHDQESSLFTAKKNTVHHHHYQFPNAASNYRSIRKTTPPM